MGREDSFGDEFFVLSVKPTKEVVELIREGG